MNPRQHAGYFPLILYSTDVKQDCKGTLVSPSKEIIWIKLSRWSRHEPALCRLLSYKRLGHFFHISFFKGSGTLVLANVFFSEFWGL